MTKPPSNPAHPSGPPSRGPAIPPVGSPPAPGPADVPQAPARPPGQDDPQTQPGPWER